MRNIILLAPPAAGKGTVAELLKDRDGYVQLSTGNILREMALQDKELNEYLKSGKLVDDKMIMDILKKKLLTLKNCPYILDGAPRTVNQAVLYEELANELELDPGVVIYLNVPREELEKRIVSRIVCPECGASYSLADQRYMPKQEGVCDNCGTGLIQRKDDTKEAFDTRYNEYLEKTMPLIQYYTYRKSLNEVDVLETEEVYDAIKRLV